jgi:hypothetical protein
MGIWGGEFVISRGALVQLSAMLQTASAWIIPLPTSPLGLVYFVGIFTPKECGDM